nr:glycine-rich protein 23-like isoform X1 [Leptinotarsa decemlineata]
MVMVVLVVATIVPTNCTFKKWKKFYSNFEPFFDYFKKKPRHHGKVYHKEVIHHKQIPIIIPVGLGPHFGYGGQHGPDYGHGGYVGGGHGHGGPILIVGHGHGGIDQGHGGIGHGFGGHGVFEGGDGLGEHYDFEEHEGFGQEVGHHGFGLEEQQGQFYVSQGFDHLGYGHGHE